MSPIINRLILKGHIDYNPQLDHSNELIEVLGIQGYDRLLGTIKGIVTTSSLLSTFIEVDLLTRI